MSVKRSIVFYLALTLSLCVFSFTVVGDFPLKWIAYGMLVLISYLVSRILAWEPGILKDFLFVRTGVRQAVVLMAVLIICAVMAVIYRADTARTVFPASIGYFTIVSMGIGCAEEVLFRGLLQGLLDKLNAWSAILLAAFSHSLYKTLLILPDSNLLSQDVILLFSFTLGIGVLLGLSKKISGSLWPCIAAHMLFDLLVYADTQDAPWWVW